MHQSSLSGPPQAAAMGLGVLCVPLAHGELGGLVEGHLDTLVAACLGGLGQPGGFQRAHAASLVLRVYLAAPGLRGHAALGQLLERLAEGLRAASPPRASEVPRTSQITDPLVVDWDLGALGRLCPCALDEAALQRESAAHCESAPGEAATVSRADASAYCVVRKAQRTGSGRVTLELEVFGEGQLDAQAAASRLSWPSGSAQPSQHACAQVGDSCPLQATCTLHYEEVPAGEELQI